MAVVIWEVGGSIRDRFLNIQNKDKDFAVECGSYEEMRDHLLSAGFDIFLEKPEYLTIRGRFPNEKDPDGKLWVGDFVMCRKEGAYSDGRRPDEVQPGTILDDLARRDFTVNAMARNVVTGEVLDPHGGREHLAQRRLTCVGSAEERLSEDALRAVRAIRFRITKGFRWGPDVSEVLLEGDWLPDALESVSAERISDELTKCFRFSTLDTLKVLDVLPFEVVEAMFSRGLWLKPTLEKP